MKLSKLIMLIVIVSFVTSIVSFFALQMYKIDSIKMLDMEINVENVYGLNVDTDALYFGSVPPGSGSMRKYTLKGDERPHFIKMEVFGDLAPWTSFSDNYFILQPDEEMNVSVTVNVPAGIPHGKYNGKMKVTIMRSR